MENCANLKKIKKKVEKSSLKTHFYILIFSIFTTNNKKTPMVRASEAEAQMSLFDNPFDMMCKLKLQEEEGKEELKKFFPMFKELENIV